MPGQGLAAPAAGGGQGGCTGICLTHHALACHASLACDCKRCVQVWVHVFKLALLVLLLGMLLWRLLLWQRRMLLLLLLLLLLGGGQGV